MAGVDPPLTSVKRPNGWPAVPGCFHHPPNRRFKVSLTSAGFALPAIAFIT
jgi:hypothetical protein